MVRKNPQHEILPGIFHREYLLKNEQIRLFRALSIARVVQAAKLLDVLLDNSLDTAARTVHLN
jgi:hypothetical protein